MVVTLTIVRSTMKHKCYSMYVAPEESVLNRWSVSPANKAKRSSDPHVIPELSSVGVWIRWNGAVEWLGGMDYWTGIPGHLYSTTAPFWSTIAERTSTARRHNFMLYRRSPCAAVTYCLIVYRFLLDRKW